jgi:hypothetical protein
MLPTVYVLSTSILRLNISTFRTQILEDFKKGLVRGLLDFLISGEKISSYSLYNTCLFFYFLLEYF